MSVPPRRTIYDEYPVPVLGGVYNGVFGTFPETYVTFKEKENKPAVIVGGREMPSHLSSTAVELYKRLRDLSCREEGLHVVALASSLQLSFRQVFDAADELLCAGLTFTTIDEDTWAALDC